MSYDTLHVVMIGIAKFLVRWAIISYLLRSKIITASVREPHNVCVANS